MNRAREIRRRLERSLSPAELEIVDESHLHARHPGARDGRGHFRVTIVSDAFDGVKPVARHRMVHDALDELLRTDIHALSIRALTPDET